MARGRFFTPGLTGSRERDPDLGGCPRWGVQSRKPSFSFCFEDASLGLLLAWKELPLAATQPHLRCPVASTKSGLHPPERPSSPGRGGERQLAQTSAQNYSKLHTKRHRDWSLPPPGTQFPPHETGRLPPRSLSALKVRALGRLVQKGHTAAALSPKLGQSPLRPLEEFSAISLCPEFWNLLLPRPGPRLVLFSSTGSQPLPGARKQTLPVVSQLGCPGWP